MNVASASSMTGAPRAALSYVRVNNSCEFKSYPLLNHGSHSDQIYRYFTSMTGAPRAALSRSEALRITHKNLEMGSSKQRPGGGSQWLHV